jgi:hypothetical protein
MKLKNEGIEIDINNLDNVIEALNLFKYLRDSNKLEDGDFEGFGNLGIGFCDNVIFIEEYEDDGEDE